jgi:hypothetical protein
MLFLFASPENRIWRLHFSAEPKVEQVNKLLGRTASRFSQWRKGEAVTQQAALDMFANAEKGLQKNINRRNRAMALKMLEAYREAYLAGDVPLSQMAVMIGIHPDDGRRCIDEIIYADHPLLPQMLEGPASRFPKHSAETLEQLKGEYKCIVKRGNDTLICALQVRYLIKIADGFAIRCKLHVPKYPQWESASGSTYFEYDGFVSKRDGSLYWVFDKRHGERADFFFIITNLPQRGEVAFDIEGKYLTTGQERDRPQIVSEQILMQREAVKDGEGSGFMRTTPDIVRGRGSTPGKPRVRVKSR